MLAGGQGHGAVAQARGTGARVEAAEGRGEVHWTYRERWDEEGPRDGGGAARCKEGRGNRRRAAPGRGGRIPRRA